MDIRSRSKPLIAKSLSVGMLSAFVQQFYIMVFYASSLDGGVTAKVCLIGFASFWACVPVVIFRRRFSPTNVDVFLVHAGTLITCVLAFAVWERISR